MTNKVQEAKNEANVGAHVFVATLLGVVGFAGLVMGMRVNEMLYALIPSAIVGFAVFLWRVMEHDNRAYGIAVEPEIVTEYIEVMTPPDKNYVIIGNQYVWQPKPAALAELLREAVGSGRKEFSLRRALAAGWNEPEYFAVVSQLSVMGWFDGDLHNRAPQVVNDKLGEVDEWLRMTG